MDNGYPITPYIVETDYKGNIDIHLQTSYGDSVRYYEELSDSQSNKKEKLEKIPMPQISLFDYYKNKKGERIMKKNIFDEALKEISYATIDLEDLEIIVNYDIDKIEKALKLGKLYKQLNIIYEIEIIKLKQKIKELENE